MFLVNELIDRWAITQNKWNFSPRVSWFKCPEHQSGGTIRPTHFWRCQLENTMIACNLETVSYGRKQPGPKWQNNYIHARSLITQRAMFSLIVIYNFHAPRQSESIYRTTMAIKYMYIYISVWSQTCVCLTDEIQNNLARDRVSRSLEHNFNIDSPSAASVLWTRARAPFVCVFVTAIYNNPIARSISTCGHIIAPCRLSRAITRVKFATFQKFRSQSAHICMDLTGHSCAENILDCAHSSVFCMAPLGIFFAVESKTEAAQQTVKCGQKRTSQSRTLLLEMKCTCELRIAGT